MKASWWITRSAYLQGRKARQSGLSDSKAPNGNHHRKSWLRGYYDDSETMLRVLAMKLKGD